MIPPDEPPFDSAPKRPVRPDFPPPSQSGEARQESASSPFQEDSDESLQLELATHPHDAYFKRVFSDPLHARAFFQHHLPPAIADSADWQTLELVPSSFVKTNLHQAHSDLAFSVNLGSSPAFLYLLFEHQTTVDEAMPLRLLRYMVEIWEAWRNQNGLPLPPILPFVLHQGPGKWTVSTEFSSLFDHKQHPEELGQYLPHFRHALLDLSQHDPAVQETDFHMRVVLQLMKLSRQQKVLAFFEWLAEQALAAMPQSLLNLSLFYALHSEADLDIEAIFRKLQSSPKLQQDTMSTAQKLINQGREEGLERGLEQGLERGRERGLWIGKLQMLEELMSLPVTPTSLLNDLPLEELKARFEVLQRQYSERFKAR